MQKDKWEIYDVVIETLTAAGVLLYLGLQFYYRMLYEIEWSTLLYHVSPILLLYAGTLLLQRNPEWLNGRNSEALYGKVRLYAVRMIRNSKFLLILGMLVPGIADIIGVHIHDGYSLLIMACILGIIGYYMFRIYQYNKEQDEKKR
ncbi:MAG: hypothetical protein J6A92_06555 [Lachnospiraceae bacterium]|nr:hypothetical protein [Lachnospiraceae bacterium]